MSTSETAAPAPEKKPNKGFATLQRLGRTLMLPIAVLPAAGILLRIGQADLLGAIPGFEGGAAVISAAGNAVFTWLPLIFAVGIAIGWAKKADGSTALAAVVGYLVLQGVFEAMSPIILGAPAEGEEQELINFGVLGGIITGLIAAMLWQRFYRIKLPTYLAFFGGRRFVPIITALTMMVVAVLPLLGYSWVKPRVTHPRQAVRPHTRLRGGDFGTRKRPPLPPGP